MNSDSVLRDDVQKLCKETKELSKMVRNQRMRVTLPDSMTNEISDRIENATKNAINGMTIRRQKELEDEFISSTDALVQNIKELKEVTAKAKTGVTWFQKYESVLKAARTGMWTLLPLMLIIMLSWVIMYFTASKIPSDISQRGWWGVLFIAVSIGVLSGATFVCRKIYLKVMSWIEKRR